MTVIYGFWWVIGNKGWDALQACLLYFLNLEEPFRWCCLGSWHFWNSCTKVRIDYQHKSRKSIRLPIYNYSLSHECILRDQSKAEPNPIQRNDAIYLNQKTPRGLIIVWRQSTPSQRWWMSSSIDCNALRIWQMGHLPHLWWRIPPPKL